MTGPSRRAWAGSVGAATYVPGHAAAAHLRLAHRAVAARHRPARRAGGGARAAWPSVVAAESVDVVLVAGDVYDRAVPVGRRDGGARPGGRAAAARRRRGGHDPRATTTPRAGWAPSPACSPAAGLHVRAATGRLDEPVLLADEHGEVAVYGLPFLEPEVARHELGLSGGAQPRGGADGGDGPGPRRPVPPARRRSVVLAHAFVGGGVASDSERDICVGGVDLVPASVFDGVDYVALGHLHRPQTLTPRLRYSGSPLAYSFGEAGQQKQAWLVDLDAGGLAEVRAGPAARAAAAAACSPAPLAELLADPAHAAAEAHFVSARLTDPVRPPTRCAGCRPGSRTACTWSGRGRAPADGRSYQERLRGRSDLEVAGEFVGHVARRRPRAPPSASCWPAALGAAGRRGGRAGEAAPARADRVRPVRRHRARSTSTRSAATGCSCCGARPARARRRCSTRSSSPSTAPCPARAARRSGCAATTPTPTTRTEVDLRADPGRRAAAGHPPARAAAAQEARRAGGPPSRPG